MGQDIKKSKFSDADFTEFSKKLSIETQYLKKLFSSESFESNKYVAGLELEAWLLDKSFNANPIYNDFLPLSHSEYITPELAKFNFELNVDPIPLNGSILKKLDKDIQRHWENSQSTAKKLNAKVMLIGILPTLNNDDLVIENMSQSARYKALNEQVIAKRKGKPLKLHIAGQETLLTEHLDVMLESAATSMQTHIQVPVEKSVAYYNSSIFISAFTVAASANSPFLFGKTLWEESRIPLFEQSVESGGFDTAANGPLHRVSFGSDYCHHSLFECFEENLDHFPTLLPMIFDTEESELKHLRLHNGTIWRWNRPIIGFNNIGQPHLRIEHRVIPSGPSLIDQIANTALYYGLVNYFSENLHPELLDIGFSVAKDNFYKAARHGLNAHVKWLDGESYTVQQLFNKHLLSHAEHGLHSLDIDKEDTAKYMNIIKNRVSTKRTGSYWQQNFVKEHGNDMQLLTEQYYLNQITNKPVHEWDWELKNAE